MTRLAAAISRFSVRREPSCRGVTLIEILVVVGMMVVLVGGIGVALAGRGGEAAALTAAQSLVASLVGTTRAQAALHQTNARLIIYAQPPSAGNPDNTRYLRVLQVVRQETLANGSTVWVAVGAPVTLPSPICVVPPAPVPANHLRQGVTWNNNPATGPTSTLMRVNMNYRGQSGATTLQYFGTQGAAQSVYHLEFGADGTVTSNTTGNPTKIALAPAVLSTSTFPQFSNANSVRGLFIRRSGAVSLVDEATGF